MADAGIDAFARSASVFRLVADLAVVGGQTACHTFRRAEAFVSWCDFRRKALADRDAHVRFTSGASLISLWDLLHNEGAVFELRVIFLPRDGLSVLAVACQKRIAHHSPIFSFRRQHERTVADVFDALERCDGPRLARAFLGYESSSVDLAWEAHKEAMHVNQFRRSARVCAFERTISRAIEGEDLCSDLLSDTGLVAKMPVRGIMMYVALSYLVSRTPDLSESHWEDSLKQHFSELGMVHDKFYDSIERVLSDIWQWSHSDSAAWCEEPALYAYDGLFELYDDQDSAVFYDQIQHVRKTWDIRYE